MYPLYWENEQKTGKKELPKAFLSILKVCWKPGGRSGPSPGKRRCKKQANRSTTEATLGHLWAHSCEKRVPAEPQRAGANVYFPVLLAGSDAQPSALDLPDALEASPSAGGLWPGPASAAADKGLMLC